MNLDGRLKELNAKHQDLEREIDAELKHPASDAGRVAMMKKQKLHLKDKIARLVDGH
ncbi:MAG: YdcH family protein [Maricaulaceae bacterium]|jgi:hypothetical protein